MRHSGLDHSNLRVHLMAYRHYCDIVGQTSINSQPSTIDRGGSCDLPYQSSAVKNRQPAFPFIFDSIPSFHFSVDGNDNKMRRISLLLILSSWLVLWQDVSAFASSSVKGASKPAHRPRTVSSSGTALHAVAKKKKTTAAKKAKATKKEVVTVKKPELIEQMAQKCELPKRDTEAALNAFLEVVQQNVAEGKKVTLVGFGSFTLKERAARKGRNPATGEELDIPASKAPGFSAGKVWKDRVNGK